MDYNNQEEKVCGFCGWFEYEEDRQSEPARDPDTESYEKIWREVEEIKAEAEAEGEVVDEEWMGQKYVELDREYENKPPTDEEIASQNRTLIKRQRDFQLAAEYLTDEFCRMPEVQRLVAFGSVASPLEFEVPRFRKFRRAGVAVRHECKDLDIAVWLTRIDNLRALQKARGRALNRLFEEEDIGVAHHQVDVFIMEHGTDRFLGNLCIYAKCPRGKPKCAVEVCGKVKYLMLHEDFTLDDDALSPDRIRVLFKRSSE